MATKTAKKTAKKAAKKATVKKVAKTASETHAEKKEVKKGCVPPKNARHSGRLNAFGLFDNVGYVFKENGDVDWKAMIDPANLVVNEDWFVRYKKDIPSSTEGLKDEQMIITLQGFKDLAKLRGYQSVSFDVLESSKEYVSVKCSIQWRGNYETLDQSIYYEELANASVYNTDSFASVFLETIGANRAFSRCVRNFLNINIVGSEEVGSRSAKKLQIGEEAEVTEEASGSWGVGIHGILMKSFESKFAKDGFDDFLGFLRSAYSKEIYRNENASKWKTIEDIDPKDCREILKVIKEWEK